MKTWFYIKKGDKMGIFLYRMLERLNGEKGNKRVIFSYKTYELLKIIIAVYLIK